jgi:hypothetical protein
MLNFKTITINTTKKKDEIISQLSWKTNEVNSLWFAKTNSFFSDTNHPLIGKIDAENRQFKITRLRPFVQSFLPQVFVKGEITDTNKESVLILKFQPGFFTTLFLLFLIWGMTVVIYQILNSDTNVIIWDGLIWILVFPVMTILLLLKEVNNTVRIINRELELGNE